MQAAQLSDDGTSEPEWLEVMMTASAWQAGHTASLSGSACQADAVIIMMNDHHHVPHGTVPGVQPQTSTYEQPCRLLYDGLSKQSCKQRRLSLTPWVRACPPRP